MIHGFKRFLKFGQTPFDTLTKKDLLFLCKKYYDTINTLHSIVLMHRGRNKDDPYWNEGGSGRQALLQADECLVEVGTSDERRDAIYRSFYRYASGLLYQHPELDRHWMVCDKCSSMMAKLGTPMQVCICGGPLRPITWDDLKEKR